MVEHLRRVEDVIEVDYIENTAEAFALLRGPKGRRPMAGREEDVDAKIAEEDGAVYVKAYGAV